MGITKTDFMRGMQCPKMLWLDKHKPKLKVIPPEVQRRLDAGNNFGDRAMGMFGPFEEMTVYLPGTHIKNFKSVLTTGGVFVFILTEEGRVFDDSSFPIKELEGGKWVTNHSPASLGSIMTGRVLSEAELSEIIAFRESRQDA